MSVAMPEAKSPSPAYLDYRYGELSPRSLFLGPAKLPRARLPRSGNFHQRAKGSCGPENDFGFQGRIIRGLEQAVFGALTVSPAQYNRPPDPGQATVGTNAPGAGSGSNQSSASSSGGGSQSSGGGGSSSSSSSSGGSSNGSSSAAGGGPPVTGSWSTPGRGSSPPTGPLGSTPANDSPVPLAGLPLPVQFGQGNSRASPCPEQESRFGFPWPETPPGDAIYVDCPNGYEGQIGRYCRPSGRWSRVADNCVSEDLKQVDNDLADGPRGIGPAIEVASRLRRSLDPDRILYDGEVQVARKAVRKLCDWDPLGFKDTGVEDAADFVWASSGYLRPQQLYIGAVGRLLHKNTKDLWDNIRNADQVNETLTPLVSEDEDDAEDDTTFDPVISLVLKTEEFGGKVAKFLNSSIMELLKTNETSIDFEAKKVDISNFSGLYYPPSASGVDFTGCGDTTANGSSAFFYLPSSALEKGNDQFAGVVNILFRDVPFLLEGENQTSNGTVGSVVMSSSVYPPIKKRFTEPIKIKFLHEEIPANTYSRRCVFVNDGGDATEENQWSAEGCEVEESTDTCTICSCNHLTNFAILMQPVDLELTDDQQGALCYITLVGSSVSLLSLATTIFLLLFFGCWKTERSFLLMNLVLALMAAQVTFLAGINATNNQTTCRAVAILIHYFFLASFFWMMAHGIQLFFKVKSVFSATRDRRVEFFLFGWINPGAIVIVTSGVKPDGYEIEK
ncbi:hypothetical protein Bbelb_397710 [Branchiostoma belcheri]|nr:hypothetical protein Bbelb_397710 [Branchiostoma belcheri]